MLHSSTSHRLSTLDTLGLVLYKRVFFHLSNLMHESKRQSALQFTKDYEAICNEWLGGLKPLPVQIRHPQGPARPAP